MGARIFKPMSLSFDQFFRLLSDETRLRSLSLLHLEDELCVCELVHALGVIQPKVSRHLAALRDYGVVTDRRSGQWIYYRIARDLPAWARQVLAATVSEAAACEPFVKDRATLAQMPNRPGAARCA